MRNRFKNWMRCGVVALCLGVALLFVVDLRSVAQSQTPAPLRLLQSDASRVVAELEVSNYDARAQTVNGAIFANLSMAELGHTNEPGKPQLPTQGALIGIPAGADVSLQVLADDARAEPLAYPPLPAPTAQVDFAPGQTLPTYRGNAFTPDAATYAADQFYPTEAVRLASPGTWRSQRVARLEFNPLQYNAAAHQLLFHRRLRVALTFRYANGATLESLGGQVDEGSFEPVFAQSILNYASAKNWRARDTTLRRPATRSSAATTATPMYKVAVNSDGIYQITCAQLASAGVDLNALDPNTLKIYKQGTEMAVNVAGNNWSSCNSANHYLEFFGEAARTRYTDTNIYWLTYGGAVHKPMAQRNGSGSGTPATTFSNNVHIEHNWIYISSIPNVEGADHWYSYYLPAPADPDGNGDPNSADYGFAADNLATGSYSATLQFSLHAYLAGNHHTRFYINSNLVGDTTWGGLVPLTGTLTFPQSYLSAITNTLRVSELMPNIIYINNFDVSYARTYNARNDVIRFRQPSSGVWQYQVGGFSSSAIETFDISDPFNVAQFVNTTVLSASAPYTLQFADPITSAHEYIALTTAQRKSPLNITLDTPSNLRSAANSADYIIIAHGSLIPNIQPLATFRQAQGLRVKVVDVQDVYDEFSDGLMDAQAIHDFLQFAYASWQPPAPQYVLLVGNGNFDFKNYYGANAPNFIPPYLRLVDPWIGETASDNQLVAFNAGNPLPSLYIGRLPARSAADVDAMVAKIIGYEQNPPPGDWRTQMTFVTDNVYNAAGVIDGAGNFWALSDGVASSPTYMPSPLKADRIYYNPCDGAVYPQCALPPSYASYPTSAAAHSAVIAAINDGRLIVNYVGHSAIFSWAEQLLGTVDMPSLANGNKLPVMLTMTCYDGYFQHPLTEATGAAIVRLAGRGALASWAASGLGVATGHDYLHRGFYNAVMQQGMLQLGPATVAGKMNLWLNSGGDNLDLIDTFNLLGDPASRLAILRWPTFLPLVVH